MYLALKIFISFQFLYIFILFGNDNEKVLKRIEIQKNPVVMLMRNCNNGLLQQGSEKACFINGCKDKARGSF